MQRIENDHQIIYTFTTEDDYIFSEENETDSDIYIEMVHIEYQNPKCNNKYVNMLIEDAHLGVVKIFNTNEILFNIILIWRKRECFTIRFISQYITTFDVKIVIIKTTKEKMIENLMSRF